MSNDRSHVFFSNLRHRYSTGFTLDLPNLSLECGRVHVLLGPSGSGKSTLVRLLTGLLEPDHGTVALPQNLNRQPDRRPVFSMVFQDYVLYPHLTVADNAILAFAVDSAEHKRRFSVLRECASLLGIEMLLDRKPADLSGGERQRSAILKVLVSGAPIWVMDEPLANLDRRIRLEIRRVIFEWQRRQHATLFYVTHEVTDALAIADTVVVMSGGRVLQAGPTEEVMTRPACIDVAHATSDPPVNALPGKLYRKGPNGVLAFKNGCEIDLGPNVGGFRENHAVLATISPLQATCLPEGSSVPTANLCGRVVLVERGEGRRLVDCDTDLGAFRASIDGTWLPEIGSPVNIVFSPYGLTLFDEKNGARLD